MKSTMKQVYKEKKSGIHENIDYFFIILFFLLVVLLKLFLLRLVPISVPTVIDEVRYLCIAQNKQLIDNQYPPLYPLFLSIFYSTQIQETYFVAKILNSFVSTSIIFPVFFLSRLFLSKQLSVIISIFSLFTPVGFTYTFLVMSENLFYPLFLASVFFFFRAEKEKKKWIYILTGTITSLVVLTRMIGLILVVAYILYIVYKQIAYKDWNPYRVITIIFCFIVLIPYFVIRSVILSNLSYEVVLGYSFFSPLRSLDYSIIMTTKEVISHFDYLMLGGGIIIGILSFVELYSILRNKEKSLFADFTIFSWLCIFSTVIVSGIFLSGEQRTLSRYVAFLIPLLFITGFKGIHKWNNKKSRIFLFTSTLVFILLLFVNINNGSEIEILNSYFLVSEEDFNNIILTGVIIVSVFFFVLLHPRLNIRKKRKIGTNLGVLFVWLLLIVGSTISFQHRVAAAQYSFGKDIIGKCIYQNSSNKIVFDRDNFKELRSYFWKIKFWSNSNVSIGNTTSNTQCLLLTTKELSYPILAKQNVTDRNGNTTLLYLYNVKKDEIEEIKEDN